MANHEPGSQAVTILLGNVPVSTLNPLPTTGGGGGGGGIVTQGAGSGLPTGAWTTRLSNGTAFYSALTDAELRASPVPVSAASLPLPTGAATAANQATEIASLASIDGKLTSPLAVTGPLTDTQLRASAVAISASALPLPTGAATEATLLNVDANLTDIQGQQTDGTQRTKITDGTNDVAVLNSAPVGTEYGLLVRQVGASSLPTGAATAANQATEIASLASIDSKLTAPLSVTGPLTDAQLRAAAVPVSAASLPLPTGAATAANQTNGTQLAQVSNGTNSAGVLNTAPVGTEYSLLVRTVGSTSAAITSIPYSGLTAAVVPLQAAFIGGTDSNGLLRGLAANADNDANPSSGKAVTLPAITKNTAPTWQNNKVVPLWIDTASALLMTSAAQGAPNASIANAWPFKLTDGTNSITLTNSAPSSSAYAVPVRPILPSSTTGSTTAVTGIVAGASTTILAANANAKVRILYNPSDYTVFIGFSTAVSPANPNGTCAFIIQPRQTVTLSKCADGLCEWTGLITGTLETAGFIGAINATEIV